MHLGGCKVKSFKPIAKASRLHFESFLRDPKEPNIGEIMKIIRLFSYLINEEMNKALNEKITGS
jgi:hypothetical protein